jgi:HlyD family secretion protein
MNQSKRRLTIGLVVVLAATIGYGAYHYWPRKPTQQFETAKIERGKIVAKVTATGTLSALVTVQVGAQVSGTCLKWFTDFNAPVKKGQVLAQLDPALFQAAVEQGKANVLAAKGSLEKAKVQAVNDGKIYERDKKLFAQKLLAEQDLETAQAAYDGDVAAVAAAEGALAQAVASLHQAQINLGYTTIVTPTTGTVISRLIDVGQTVAASLQTPTLFTVAEDMQKMQVDTSVAESDVGKLHDGMDATFTVDAYTGDVFHGKVRQVRNSPQTVQNVVTYDAVIDVRNDDFRLKPGMTASASFVYAEREDAVRIPNTALRFRPPTELRKKLATAAGKPGGSARAAVAGEPPKREKGGDGYAAGSARAPRSVWVLRNGEPVEVKVRLGVSDGTATEMLDGELKEGDEVITELAATAGSTASRNPMMGPMGGGGVRR